MFDVLFDIKGIIMQVEVTLKINNADYNLSADNALNRIFSRLEEQYAVDFRKTTIAEQSLVDPNIGRLLENLANIYERFAAYGALCRYNHNTSVSLGNIANLRTSSEALSRFLAGCSDVRYEKNIDGAMKALKVRYTKCPLSIERELILIMLLFHELELHELVGVVADILLYSLLEGETV